MASKMLIILLSGLAIASGYTTVDRFSTLETSTRETTVPEEPTTEETTRAPSETYRETTIEETTTQEMPRETTDPIARTSETEGPFTTDTRPVTTYDFISTEAPMPTTEEQPRPCDDVPLPCPEFQTYADATDCRHYFQCLQGALYRIECRDDYGYDIYVHQCMYITPDFNCELRCP